MKKETSGATLHMYTLLSREEKLRQGRVGESIVDLVDDLFYKALAYNSSDIHFQPQSDCVTVRYRIDGVLYDQQHLDIATGIQSISRIKVLSGLDISEKRLPQDGKFNLAWEGFEQEEGVVDFRISTFPSIYGEKLVIRVLNRSVNTLDINVLGMPLPILDEIKTITAIPYGFFLVTGPTGSGKTTTLYSMLSEVNYEQKNVVTMEDPVEYDLQGITQSQVNDRIGFSFENGLRSLLRQDPDVIMIGEIRDQKTVRIAIESALTGHLVLSTLHTNDAASAITRLLDMGVEPFLINATLNGVLAQRLARKLCEACKVKEALTKDEKMILSSYNYTHDYVFRAKGCEECFLLGYRGRVGIFELLTVSDELRELIGRSASIEELGACLAINQFQPLSSDGLSKVAQGIISLEEFLSIIVI